ncbi:MAG: response regulator [Dehalococcoidales bacterium]|nr:response regulator [Dehalococcoidales bacterium]
MKNDKPFTRILVVEDEPAISEIVVRVLTNDQTQVFIAANGRMAQTMLASNDFDVCLLDIRTPAMSGKELYTWMQEHHPGLIPGVIFTTGDTMSNNIENFIEESGRPYLPKPFTPDELKTIISNTLQDNKKKADA